MRCVITRGKFGRGEVQTNVRSLIGTGKTTARKQLSSFFGIVPSATKSTGQGSSTDNGGPKPTQNPGGDGVSGTHWLYIRICFCAVRLVVRIGVFNSVSRELISYTHEFVFVGYDLWFLSESLIRSLGILKSVSPDLKIGLSGSLNRSLNPGRPMLNYLPGCFLV